MAELEHEVDETKSAQDVAVSEEGAATPHAEDAKPLARQVVPHNKRLFAAMLTCFVVALVALGVWAFQSFAGSAALTTVAPEEAKAEGGKTDATQDRSSAKSKQEASGQATAAKPEQQPPATQEQAPQPQPAPAPTPAPTPAPDPVASTAPATQDASAGDPVVTTTVVEEPASTPASVPTPEPASESSTVVATEPAPEPAPELAPTPAPEPTEMTIRVSIDGTPAGGGYRDATVALAPGANVYDALLATGAGVNARGSVYGTYVAAIDGLAEKDHGGMSGWVYAVNGVEPQTACSNYTLSDGDVVAWYYVNAEY